MFQSVAINLKRMFMLSLLIGLFSLNAYAHQGFPDLINSSSQRLYGSQFAVSCNLCHGSSNGFHDDFVNTVNASGFSTNGLSQSQMDTVIKAMENTDSDGDGFSNKEEFTASTDPSDNSSKPPTVIPAPVEQPPVVQPPVVQPPVVVQPPTSQPPTSNGGHSGQGMSGSQGRSRMHHRNLAMSSSGSADSGTRSAKHSGKCSKSSASASSASQSDQ